MSVEVIVHPEGNIHAAVIDRVAEIFREQPHEYQRLFDYIEQRVTGLDNHQKYSIVCRALFQLIHRTQSSGKALESTAKNISITSIQRQIDQDFDLLNKVSQNGHLGNQLAKEVVLKSLEGIVHSSRVAPQNYPGKSSDK